MALPMVHLLAARAWAKDKPALLNCPEYYLGAVSPDAIHIRDGNDKSNKNAVHLNNWRGPDADSVYAYWQENDAPFDIGYGIHVLLDGQWSIHFRQELPQILLPNGKPNPDLYYQDTCVTDFELMKDSSSAELWEMVRTAEAPTDHPLLSRHEIDAWRLDILGLYGGKCPRSGEARYITCEYVTDFLNNCGRLFDETYGRLKK